jgi:hypothetical protein
MTTRAMAPLPARTVRDAGPAALAGVLAPHVVALVSSRLASAPSPWSPVRLLLIASSALGFRLSARG